MYHVHIIFSAFMLKEVFAGAPARETETANHDSKDGVSLIQITGDQLVRRLDSDTKPWKGDHVNDLHEQYYNIFKSGNRNAASHLWSSFLLDRSHEMNQQKLTYFFSGFCGVSGSPLEPLDRTRYRLTLDKVGGGKQTGYMYYCCWPCLCDTRDYIQVDTKNITTKDGEAQYHFAVIGNPCHRPEDLSKPFDDLSGGETTLEREAPELRCQNGKLEGAHVSDHGHIIISMFFDENQSSKSIDEAMFNGKCEERAKAGYDSGMGQIFRKVAAISRGKLDADKSE